MNFKRFNGSTWETVRHKIYGSGTDSLTAFPAMIQAAGEPLTDYTIYGNTLQNGTPTPEAPVDVVGCGVRTAQLFDKNTVTRNAYINDITGVLEPYTGNLCASNYIDVSGIDTFYITPNFSASWGAFYDESKSFIKGFSKYEKETTVPTNAKYMRCTVSALLLDKTMLNVGSTPLPYEPYGYKIPISVNGTEYPIYLGQVETTRRIKKLVLTGEEIFFKNSSSSTDCLYYAQRMDILTGSVARTPLFCNELPAKTEPPISDIGMNTNNSFSIVYFNFGADVMNAQPSGNTADGLKEYLAAQYAAGTPVTVWYVLAEPETAVVNEPIHKIGNYADTITMAQAGVAIPTFDGDNIISFGTTVHPSAMSATFKGWHPVQGAKVYDGNDWR